MNPIPITTNNVANFTLDLLMLKDGTWFTGKTISRIKHCIYELLLPGFKIATHIAREWEPEYGKNMTISSARIRQEYGYLIVYLHRKWIWDASQALNPLWIELQGLLGMLTQAWAATLVIVFLLMPALQIFARERMCFIPYWDSDPQCVSKVRTWQCKPIKKVIFLCLFVWWSKWI